MSASDANDVVVTGGAGALGSAVVEALLAAGARCHVPVRAPTERWRGDARVSVVVGVDLTDEAAVARFYADRPPIAASIHLAGGFAMGPITGIGLAEWRAQHELNVVTCFLSCREAVKRMRGRGGRIVNVASRVVLAPTGGMTAYSAAKCGVAGLTQALAEEVRGEGILVNAVVPTTLDTPQNRAAMPGAKGLTPLQAVAEAIVYLASTRNQAVTGALVPVA